MRILRAALTFALVSALAVPAIPAGAAPFESVRYSGSTAYLAGGFSVDGNRTGMVAASTDDGLTWGGSAMTGAHMLGTAAFGSQLWSVSSFKATPFIGAGLPLAATSVLGQPAPYTSPLNDPASDVLATGADSAVVVGQAAAIDAYGDPAAAWRTTDGGATWTAKLLTAKLPQNATDGSQPEVNARLRSIDAAGGAIYAVGCEWMADSTAIPANRSKSLVYKSTDGGANWTQLNVVTSPVADLIAVDAVDASTVWAVGLAAGATSNGTILRSTDGGATWKATAIPLQIVNSATTKPTPTSIAAISATKAVVGYDGGVLIVDASTVTPTFAIKPVAPGKVIRSVAMRDANVGIAVGDGETVLRTADGGATWTGVTVASAPTLAVTSPAKGFTVSSGVMVPIAGTAADPSTGISTVRISIMRGDGYYWNGTSFATKTPTWLDATTSDGYKNWTYGWTPTGAASSVVISARAFDLAGNAVSAAPVAQQQLGTVVTASATTPAYAGTSYATVSLKTSQGGAVYGKPIKLARWTGSTWSTVGTLSAASNSNAVKFTVKGLTTKTKFRASFAADSAYGASYRDFYITPQVSLGTPKVVKRSGRTITVSGTLRPRHTAKSRPVKVIVYKKYGSVYKSYRSFYCTASNYSSYSKYTGTYKLPSSGTYRLRAYAPADSGHAATYSSYSGGFSVK